MNDATVEDNEANAPTEGFRKPPDRVTQPCCTYMARIMELRTFVSFYFNFIKTSRELGKLIPETSEPPNGSKCFQVLKYNYSKQQPFVNQIMLSRAVESFDLYITTILRDIFLSKPELLKSKETIDIATIIEAGDYQNLIWQLVEQKVHNLSYKPLSELRTFIESRTGLDLFPNMEAFETTIIASEVRNLIAHNNCIINDIFKARIKSISMPLQTSSTGRIEIDDTWLRRTSYALDNIVFRFDELAAKKFKLQTSVA